MIASLILTLGLTFFPGQPHWYELDTSGIEWTVAYMTEVTEDDAFDVWEQAWKPAPPVYGCSPSRTTPDTNAELCV